MSHALRAIALRPSPRPARVLGPVPDGRARQHLVRRVAIPYDVGRVAEAVTCHWLCDTPVQLEIAKRVEPRHITVNLLVRVRYAVEIGGNGVALLRARLAPASREHHGCNAFSPELGEPFAFPGTINPDGVMKLVRAELRMNPRFRRHLVRLARQQGR
jgi:hypothetical protein